jgi:hypothetical protein
MAKYVLLTFEDDAAADAFVNKVTETESVTTSAYHESELKAFIRGVWKKPTKFCSCIGAMKERGFTRGRKYGWWVCTKCGKPTVGWARGDHWFLSLGRNLLPVQEGASEYRGDGEWGRYRKNCPECTGSVLSKMGHGTTTTWCPKCQKYV